MPPRHALSVFATKFIQWSHKYAADEHTDLMYQEMIIHLDTYTECPHPDNVVTNLPYTFEINSANKLPIINFFDVLASFFSQFIPNVETLNPTCTQSQLRGCIVMLTFIADDLMALMHRHNKSARCKQLPYTFNGFLAVDRRNQTQYFAFSSSRMPESRDAELARIQQLPIAQNWMRIPMAQCYNEEDLK